jgi:benzil reductase ((S)-benzoin forming)
LKTYIVTGTSGGLGNALFEELHLQEDSTLICVARRFLETQYEFACLHNHVKLVEADFSGMNDDWIHLLIEQLPAYSTEIIFISNAGTIHPIADIGKLKQADIIQSIYVNYVTAVSITIRLFSEREKYERLTIVNISSGAAHKPIVGWSLYCSMKAAAHMFFEVAKKQSETDTGINITHMDPGVMDTSMQKTIREANPQTFPTHEYFTQLSNQDLLLEPRDVAIRLLKELGGS